MTGLFRRGGIWWARLVVPERLRVIAGRREFALSTRTHELAIAKLVASVFLADWRERLHQLESRSMTLNVLKIADGAPLLAAGGYLSFAEAATLAGIQQSDMLRAAAHGRLSLFCRIGQTPGHVVAVQSFELISPEAGISGGLVAPPPDHMPAFARRLSGLVAGFKARSLSQRAMVAELNAAGVAAPRGGRWLLAQVQRLLIRVEALQA